MSAFRILPLLLSLRKHRRQANGLLTLDLRALVYEGPDSLETSPSSNYPVFTNDILAATYPETLPATISRLKMEDQISL